jgi:REP element-mobilizing transposase RayT
LKKKYNPEIHHRKSIRLKGYDYSQDGFYFITLNCWNRNHYFGEIQNGVMFLNDLGKIAHEEWKNTPKIRPYVILHEFVIMPDHLHGIIELRGIQLNSREGRMPLKSREGRMLFAPTIELIDSSKNITSSNTNFKSPSHTIGAIIRGYKSAVTKQSKSHIKEFPLWQRDYHERIIRNKTAFCTISRYIRNNPQNWEVNIE